MAKATKWLQAILDYMKVKLITSTVHTHPPNEEEEQPLCGLSHSDNSHFQCSIDFSLLHANFL